MIASELVAIRSTVAWMSAMRTRDFRPWAPGCSECDSDVPAYSRYLNRAKYGPLIDLIGIDTTDGRTDHTGAPIGA